MKKVLYILFHRSVLVALSLLAQVVTLVVMVNIFSEYINSFYWCCIAISVIAALLILGSRIEPAYKITWLLLILPFPVFGGIFYLLVGGGHIPKRISRRMRRVSEQSEENLREDFKADDRRAGPLSGALCPRSRLYQYRDRILRPGRSGFSPDAGGAEEGGAVHLPGVLHPPARRLLGQHPGHFGGEGRPGRGGPADL